MLSKMTFMKKMLNKLKSEDTQQEDNVYAPKYCTDFLWEQDSNQSITTSDGRYDLTRFSRHEAETIHHVLNIVKSKYSLKHQSIGLANESSIIKYKARYVLFEIIVLKYKDSENPIDQFAVAYAYQSKSAYWRPKAIEYFEKSISYLEDDFLREFSCLSPLNVYNSFSKLYEQEHNYEKAIYYTKLAEKYSVPNNPYFNNHINELLEKQRRNPKKRTMKMSEIQREFENNVTVAAKYFIEHNSIPSGILQI